MNSDTKQVILDAVRDGGEVLTLTFEDGKPVWHAVVLDRRISARTARYIINSVGVQFVSRRPPRKPTSTPRAR
jgi:hypothetical protein